MGRTRKKMCDVPRRLVQEKGKQCFGKDVELKSGWYNAGSLLSLSLFLSLFLSLSFSLSFSLSLSTAHLFAPAP